MAVKQFAVALVVLAAMLTALARAQDVAFRCARGR
jgi:hypothetical protein